MSINYTNTQGSYLTDRYNTILLVEEGGMAKLQPYNDGKGWVTIGLGFNLADDNVRSRVLAAMGFTNSLLISELNAWLDQRHEGTTTSAIQLKGSASNSFSRTTYATSPAH